VGNMTFNRKEKRGKKIEEDRKKKRKDERRPG
jgi:hypothetical protein